MAKRLCVSQSRASDPDADTHFAHTAIWLPFVLISAHVMTSYIWSSTQPALPALLIVCIIPPRLTIVYCSQDCVETPVQSHVLYVEATMRPYIRLFYVRENHRPILFRAQSFIEQPPRTIALYVFFSPSRISMCSIFWISVESVRALESPWWPYKHFRTASSTAAGHFIVSANQKYCVFLSKSAASPHGAENLTWWTSQIVYVESRRQQAIHHMKASIIQAQNLRTSILTFLTILMYRILIWNFILSKSSFKSL